MRAVFAVVAFSFCALAHAQGYPVKPLRLIVPFPPGGVTDISSRVVAQKLSAELGQPVVVENRAGASGVIGAEAGAKAAPDGYTLTMGNISTLAINAVTFAKLPYDPVASFAPVSMVAIQPLVISVHPSVPANTLGELVALAKAQPGKLAYGTAGSSVYLAVEFFNTAAGIRMNHVPYKGSSPAIADLIGGQLQVLFDPFSSIYPQVRSGKARGLAVTTLHGTPESLRITVQDLGILHSQRCVAVVQGSGRSALHRKVHRQRGSRVGLGPGAADNLALKFAVTELARGVFFRELRLEARGRGAAGIEFLEQHMRCVDHAAA